MSVMYPIVSLQFKDIDWIKSKLQYEIMKCYVVSLTVKDYYTPVVLKTSGKFVRLFLILFYKQIWCK